MSYFKNIRDTAVRWAVFGSFAALFMAGAAYALTYNWSDPAALRGKTPGNQLQSSQWNLLVGNVDNLNERLGNAEAAIASLSSAMPAGAVVAFFWPTCPTWWSPANGTANGVKKTDGSSGTLDLRGEFIRGLDGGRWADPSRALGTSQDGSTKLLMNGSVDPSNPGSNPEWNSPSWVIMHKPSVEMVGVQTWTWGSYTAKFTLRSAMDTTWWGASETRPRNVALLYCVKN